MCVENRCTLEKNIGFQYSIRSTHRLIVGDRRGALPDWGRHKLIGFPSTCSIASNTPQQPIPLTVPICLNECLPPCSHCLSLSLCRACGSAPQQQQQQQICGSEGQLQRAEERREPSATGTEMMRVSLPLNLPRGWRFTWGWRSCSGRGRGCGEHGCCRGRWEGSGGCVWRGANGRERPVAIQTGTFLPSSSSRSQELWFGASNTSLSSSRVRAIWKKGRGL